VVSFIALNLSEATPVNGLWAELVERLGLGKASQACRQALDLQAMRGSEQSLPLLLVETCGVGLVERELLRSETMLPVPEGEGMLLLFSKPRLQLQLMQLQR
tara:strand:- start:160 stop:465 length:306 start_codon:yes stop_codon:yes gene_type:complete